MFSGSYRTEKTHYNKISLQQNLCPGGSLNHNKSASEVLQIDYEMCLWVTATLSP